tara:strand:+ start:1864 stop:2202 length:339 start_codon:yes stop_codon:yes gene_type:complete
MKKIVTILFLVLFTSCNNDNFDINDYPECLRPIIETIMERPVQSPKANIEKWLYNGEEVYLVNGQNFPDGQSHVITLNCEDICVLGGIDGPFNDCEDWNSAEFIETIWVDPR